MNATKTATTTATKYGIEVGDYLVDGRPGDTDCDMGQIIAIDATGEVATVAWETGACMTTVALDGADVSVYSDYEVALADLRARRVTVDTGRR